MDRFTARLDKIPIDCHCRLYEIEDSLSVKGRLNELGFVKNAELHKIHVGSQGSPIACRICGAVIAVRSEDAEKIIVKL